MFTEHLREAISINKARRKIYIELSDGKSKSLSNRLIFFERLLIIPAMFFDWRAKRFIRKGIPIMQNDFVPMNKLPMPETMPKFKNSLSANTLKELILKLNDFNKAVKRELKVKNFEEISAEGKKLLEYIEKTEHEFECHLAMLKHITESLNLIVRNGIGYIKMSRGGTVKMTKTMINGHLFILKPGLKTIDLPAQKLHSIACGIIVNDMPQIKLID